MQASGPDIIRALCDKLDSDSGRHLYAVVGTYRGLDRFEAEDLAQARTPSGSAFPLPINLNREVLSRIPDEELRQLVSEEARLPRYVADRLAQELRSLLQEPLATGGLIVIKQVELFFAYDLDLAIFRTHAINRSHILLLLPGAVSGERVALFHEADARFHRTVPDGVIAADHIWELPDA